VAVNIAIPDAVAPFASCPNARERVLALGAAAYRGALGVDDHCSLHCDLAVVLLAHARLADVVCMAWRMPNAHRIVGCFACCVAARLPQGFVEA
jgi:hypothetical protein